MDTYTYISHSVNCVSEYLKPLLKLSMSKFNIPHKTILHAMLVMQ